MENETTEYFLITLHVQVYYKKWYTLFTILFTFAFIDISILNLHASYFVRLYNDTNTFL